VAIFSVVQGVLLRSLPFPDADRLMVAFAAEPKQNKDRSYFSIAAVADYKTSARSLDGLVGISPNWSFTLRGKGDPEPISGLWISAGTFETLGIAAAPRARLPARRGPRGSAARGRAGP
jgi:hypothetical protein